MDEWDHDGSDARLQYTHRLVFAGRFIFSRVQSTVIHGRWERSTQSSISAWRPSSFLGDGNWYEPSMRPLDSGFRENLERFHICIKMPSGKSILVWVYAHDTVETLKVMIEQI